MAAEEWLIWQLVDSAFPIGGLAHSNGLEAAVQHGLVSDGTGLEDFVRVVMHQCSRGVLRFAQATYGGFADFEKIDLQCDLFLNNHVSNRASRAQGRAFLAASTRIFLSPQTILLSEKIRTSHSPTHFAPVFGVVAAALGLVEVQALSLFQFMLARACVGSAVRLGIVGPLEGQRIQSRLRSDSIDKYGLLPVQTAPVLDLIQGTQDRLYSRLFQS
jgi:urease accessory protein